MNGAFSCDAAEFCFLFWVSSGILQGCPLSGTLFVLCLDPMLRNINATIEFRDLAVTRACADDIGASLQALRHLALYFPIFERMRLIAKLTLKPSKCVIVPTGVPFDDEVASMFTDWLAVNIPA